MRVGKNKEAIKARQKATVDKMKKEKLGRFNSENQRKCGLQNKGIPKKAHAKNIFIIAALERGMLWEHQDGTIVTIEPNSCKGMTEVVNKLLFGFSEKQKQDFQQKQSKAFIYSATLKVINGYRDKTTNKCIYRVGPWRLLGIFVEF